MNVFIQLAEFIYNNLMTVSFFLALFVFFVFHLKQLIQETRINQKLNLKKKFARSIESVSFRRLFTKRVAVVALPLLILGGLLLFYPRESVMFDDYLNKITSKEDVVTRYENFNQRFYSHHFQDVPDRIDDVDVLKDLRQKSPTLHEKVDMVARYNDYIFSIDETNVHITRVDAGEITHLEKLTFYDEIDSHETFRPSALFVDYNKLVVVGQVKENLPVSASDSDYLQEDFRTVVRVYDIEADFEHLDTYRMDGLVSDISYNGTNLMMATTRYIPFEHATFDLDDYRPWSQANDQERHYNRYSSMRYVERVKPNSFVSFHTLNIRTGAQDFETLLTDYNHKVAMKDADVYSVANSYTFYDISDGVSLPNPIKSEDTTITQFNVIGNRMYRHRARRLEGRANMEAGIALENRDFIVMTLSDGHQIINKLDRKMMQSVRTLRLEESGAFRHMYYHQGILYLSRFVEGKPYMNVYDVRHSGGIVRMDTHQTSPLTSCSMPVGDSGYLSFNRGPSTLQAISYIVKDAPSLEYAHMRVVAPLDYDFALSDNPIGCRNVHFDAEHRKFTLPLYVSASYQEDSLMIPSILFYDVSETGRFSNPEVLELSTAFIGDTPFGYRTITMGDYRYHLTPNGIVSTSRTDFSQTIDRVLFP